MPEDLEHNLEHGENIEKNVNWIHQAHAEMKPICKGISSVNKSVPTETYDKRQAECRRHSELLFHNPGMQAILK